MPRSSTKILLKKLARKQLHKIERYATRNDVLRSILIQIYRSKLYGFIKERMEELQTYKLLQQVKKGPIPRHIAIIMDGNRRFAKELGIKPEVGHLFGRDKIEETLDWCMELGIRNLTLYAFSTENFNRSPKEVDELMDLCRRELKRALEDPRIHENQIKVKFLGHLEALPEDIREAAKELMEKTKHYDKYSLNIALAYGGREEIVQAIKRIAREVEEGKLSIEDINEENVSRYLYTDGLPDPDLILRTSGEERISNFLLWQLAYSELYFSDVYWPAFQKQDFLKAIYTYQQRKRRFGR